MWYRYKVGASVVVFCLDLMSITPSDRWHSYILCKRHFMPILNSFLICFFFTLFYVNSDELLFYTISSIYKYIHLVHFIYLQRPFVTPLSFYNFPISEEFLLHTISSTSSYMSPISDVILLHTITPISAFTSSIYPLIYLPYLRSSFLIQYLPYPLIYLIYISYILLYISSWS